LLSEGSRRADGACIIWHGQWSQHSRILTGALVLWASNGARSFAILSFSVLMSSSAGTRARLRRGHSRFRHGCGDGCRSYCAGEAGADGGGVFSADHPCRPRRHSRQKDQPRCNRRAAKRRTRRDRSAGTPASSHRYGERRAAGCGIGSHPIRVFFFSLIKRRWRDLQVLYQPQWQTQCGTRCT
jgi:hypothetical protein